MTANFIIFFTDILDRYKIKYIIVGGCASIIYNKKNYTNDLDILINPKKKNIQNLSIFLSTLNFNLNEKDFIDTGIIRIVSKPFSIDFHSKLHGINIEMAFKTYKKIKIGNKELNFISNNLLDKNLETVNQMIIKNGRFNNESNYFCRLRE